MAKKNSISKYIATPVIATSLLFTPVFAGSVSADSLFATGSNGSEVNSLQSNLSDQGFKVNADGIFGPNTQQAVKDFQKSKDLQVDGIAGKDTLGALDGKSSSSDKGTDKALYRLGSTGSSINDLQSDLGSHGYDINVDGSFGPATRSAVQSFQKAQDLQVDGIAGKDTLNALNDSSHKKDNNDSDSGASSDSAISTAKDLVGSPYVFGGTSPSGFDSSGFINYVFDKEGVNLSRTHDAMWVNDGKKVDDPSPGDVVFFENTYKSGVSHSGIYLGNNEMVHAANEDKGVEVTSMDINYWSDKYIGAKSMQ